MAATSCGTIEADQRLLTLISDIVEEADSFVLAASAAAVLLDPVQIVIVTQGYKDLPSPVNIQNCFMAQNWGQQPQQQGSNLAEILAALSSFTEHPNQQVEGTLTSWPSLDPPGSHNQPSPATSFYQNDQVQAQAPGYGYTGYNTQPTAISPEFATIPQGRSLAQDVASQPLQADAYPHQTLPSTSGEAQNAPVSTMIKTQHEHEAQWWAGRTALQQKQEARTEGDRKVEETLRAINAPTAPINKTKGQVEKDNADEIFQYDMKVHRALMTMQKHMTQDLKSLGVPFFVLQENLIAGVGEDTKALDDVQANIKSTRASSDASKRITRQELIQLQQKMLQHLQDVFGDEDE
ncbi:MAG: hypothetical protein Q9159_003786 [Coniocarpon cinnabarinum]